MKAVCILVLIYSGHHGHRDGTRGAQQGIAYSQAEGDARAAKMTFMFQHPGGKRSTTNDRIVCETIKRS